MTKKYLRLGNEAGDVEVTFSQIEIMHVAGCLLREALSFDEIAAKYRKDGYHGIAAMEKSHALVLMKVRERILRKAKI